MSDIPMFPWCWLHRQRGNATEAFTWWASSLLKQCQGPMDVQSTLDAEVLPLLRQVPEAAREIYAREVAKLARVKPSVIQKGLHSPTEKPVAGGISRESLSSRAEPHQGGEGNTDDEGLLSWISKLNEKHFVTTLGGTTVVGTIKQDLEIGRERIEYGTFQDLHKLYSHEKITIPSGRRGWRLEEVGKIWTSHPLARRYEDVLFSPGRQLPPAYLNLWRDFAVSPVQGDCGQYWDLCRNAICAGNEAHYRWVRKWLAFGVQKLDKLPRSSIVMRGLQGVGKNAFVGWYGHLYGRHYLPITSMEHLSGRFNGHLRDVLLLFLNEALWGGDRSRIGNVNGHITDELLTSESKGVDARPVRNFKRVIVGANEDWAVPRGLDDRRYFVLDVAPTYKENADFFGSLEDLMLNRGGLQALLWDLLHEDLTGYNPTAIPDGGSSGFDMKIRGQGSVVQWWQDLLYRGVNTADDDKSETWLQEILIDDLYRNYRLWNEKMQRKHLEIRVVWSRELRKLVPHLDIQQSRSEGRRRKYLLGDLTTCRKAFEVIAKSGREIWDSDTEEERAERDYADASEDCVPI